MEPIRTGDELDSRIGYIETCLLAALVEGEFWKSSEVSKHNSFVIRVISDWPAWPRQINPRTALRDVFVAFIIAFIIARCASTPICKPAISPLV